MIVCFVFFAFACSSTSSTSSTVAGNWQNELGSQMTIEVYQQIIIDGWYNSSVGYASGTYPLVGFVGQSITGQAQIICFSVLWQNDLVNSNSVTSWDGSYDPNSDTIETVWVLRSGPPNTWNNTMIGTNIFRRIKT